jgi:polysaccharide chain length determinant protein (PEP-CTERM system associated)
MQPNNVDTYAVTRRPMDVADYFDVLRRHRGWIVGPTFAGLVIAVVVAFLWPDTFISDATIRIMPPAVPERYVPSNVNLQLGQRIAAMEQQVRSRGNLLNLINQNALYPRKKGRVPDEDLVEAMQKDIQIRPVQTLREMADARPSSTAFRVTFRYENRYQAQKVVTAIISMFLDETVRTRGTESQMTTEFLKERLDSAKKSLDEIENRLTEYKMRFAGKLPEQLDSNLAQLRTIETQLSNAGSAINRATQEKLLLENNIRVLKEQLQAVTASPTATLDAAVKNERVLSLERQILLEETALAALRQQYSDSHPDVRREMARLGQLRKSRDAMSKEEASRPAAPVAKAESQPVTREQRQTQLDVERIQSLIQTKDMELEQYVKEQARLNKLIKVYSDRIEASPLGERQYAELTRDYQLRKREYEDLTAKQNQSSMATDLEQRKQGETLEVLEQASLPQSPSEPNRWFVVATGLVIGMVSGLFAAAGREMKDTSLKSLKDVRAYTGLPVLGSVPLVENDLLVQRKRRLAWVAWSGATIFGFLLMLGSVYYYYTKGA